MCLYDEEILYWYSILAVLWTVTKTLFLDIPDTWARVVVPPVGPERVPVEGQVDDGVHHAVQGHQPEQRLQLLTNLLLEPARNVIVIMIMSKTCKLAYYFNSSSILFVLWELEYELANNEGTGAENVADNDDQGQLDGLDLGSRNHHRGGPSGETNS